ncbi:MAG: hypothetical protein WCL00_05295 [Bacteroidota bacterium]
MDDLTRKHQIEKIDSLIKKQNVSRRDFFGSLGKIAVLSQVIALGAGSFLASCVAFESKKSSSGVLKECGVPGQLSYFGCGEPDNTTYDFSCNGGDYTCYDHFTCGVTLPRFYCEEAGSDLFLCGSSYPPNMELFSCGSSTGSTTEGFHYGSCGTCGG